jgi:glycosyltransferase involved in cell wall biosynthesis
MKILYLLQDVPFPPSDGMRLKVYNVIEYMARDHECHVLVFGGAAAHERAIELRNAVPGLRVLGVFPLRTGLRLLLSRVRSTALRLLPPSMGRYESVEFADTLRRLLQQESYDVVHYDVINMAQYIDVGKGTASVHSPNDATSVGYLREAEEVRQPIARAARLLSAKLLARFERRVYPRFTKIHVVSGIEAHGLRSVCPNIDVEIIAPAVDRPFLDFGAATDPPGDGTAPTLVFSGSLAIHSIANGLLEFMKLSYPRILAAFPGVRCNVLGRNPSAALRRQFDAIPGVRVIPWADDYVGAMAAANVVVFPERGGSGIKHRVLQAMCLGKAVVGSPDAFKGINAQHGVNCFICANPSAFVQAIGDALADRGLRQRLGQSARHFILTNHTMDTLGPRWVSLYEAAVKTFRTRSHASARVVAPSGRS